MQKSSKIHFFDKKIEKLVQQNVIFQKSDFFLLENVIFSNTRKKKL